MFIARLVGTAAVAAGALVALAAPSWADGPDGTYLFTDSEGDSSTWIVVSCGPTCATVTSGGWAATANLTNGRWDMTVPNPKAIVCPDGTQYRANESFSWDATTLTGKTSTPHLGECGGLPGTHTTSFIVTPK